MSEFKGTKGSWYVDHEESGKNEFDVKYTPISSDRIKTIIDVYGDDEQSEANAKLIACAPEMLEILLRCSEWIINCNENIQIVKDIDSLIKKATE